MSPEPRRQVLAAEAKVRAKDREAADDGSESGHRLRRGRDQCDSDVPAVDGVGALEARRQGAGAWRRGKPRGGEHTCTNNDCGYAAHRRPYHPGLRDSSRRAAGVMMDIVKREGVAALFRGVPTGLLLCTNPAIQFLVYERLRSRFHRPNTVMVRAPHPQHRDHAMAHA